MCIALFAWAIIPTARGFLSTIEIDVPASAITSYASYPSLTSNEDLVALKLSPAQLAALLAQLETKRDYLLGPNGSAPTKATPNGLAPSAKFFASVPKTAQGGSFRVDHGKGEKNEWPTFCEFALDRPTGRVWIYGWSVYN